MRQYYDIYSLLADEKVQAFIGTEQYFAHKAARFPKQDLAVPINENQAFLLADEKFRARYKERYQLTSALYYKGQPGFEEILERIGKIVDKL